MYRLFIFLSVALFGYSLILPIYADKPDIVGFMGLGMGWAVGVNDIPTAVSWLANVTFFFALIMILKRKRPRAGVALFLGILSILLGCAFLGAGSMMTGAATTSKIVGKLAFGTAFYAWVGSFVLITVAAWLKLKAIKASTTASTPAETDIPVKS